MGAIKKSQGGLGKQNNKQPGIGGIGGMGFGGPLKQSGGLERLGKKQ